MVLSAMVWWEGVCSLYLLPFREAPLAHWTLLPVPGTYRKILLFLPFLQPPLCLFFGLKQPLFVVRRIKCNIWTHLAINSVTEDKHNQPWLTKNDQFGLCYSCLLAVANTPIAGNLPLMIKLDQEGLTGALGAGFKAVLFTDIRRALRQ